METENLLNEREKTHGSFTDNAIVAQHLKDRFKVSPNYPKLTDKQRESLDMIATKLARILNGNPNEPDHWNDIAGYAKLAIDPIFNQPTQIANCYLCQYGFKPSEPIQQYRGHNYHQNCYEQVIKEARI